MADKERPGKEVEFVLECGAKRGKLSRKEGNAN